MSGSTVRSRFDLAWLARLRWVFLAGELVATLAWALRDPSAPWGWLALAMGGQALSNVALSFSEAASAPREARAWEGTVLGALVVDVVAVATMLALAGGPSSPFTVVLLVQVTVAAVVLRGARLFGVVAAAIASYAALFAFDAGGHAHGAGFDTHLEQMFVAFTVTAVGIAAAVSRLAAALAQERERADANARVMGMTTLAAGAAHELATPLATIKTVIGELDRELAGRSGLDHVREDLALVRAEVARSRGILDQLSIAAGELRGEAPSRVSLQALEQTLDALDDAQRARVHFRADHTVEVALPVRAVGQALQALVRNALDASARAPDPTVDVEAALEARWVVISVRDRGPGIAPEVLARLGEPFFTTKDPGRGMGLGVFLVRALAAHLGGELALDSQPGRGTIATLRLPRAPDAARPARASTVTA
jgi:two-component system sensor histidine kinase RegB